MKTKMLIFMVYCATIILVVANHVQAAGQEQAFTWGGTVQVGFDTRTGSISTIINLYDEKTYRQFGKRRDDVLRSWLQNSGLLPVFVEKYVAECIITSIGFENIVEVGMSPDMGITRYKAHAEAGKGYVYDLIGSENPLGGHSLNWYLLHKDSKGRLVLIILVFSWPKQETAMGGCFLMITKAPPDWEEMPLDLQLSHNHGFFPVSAWSNQPEKVAQWRAERQNFGDILIKGKVGNMVEFECSNGQKGIQEIMPQTEGFALTKLSVGTEVYAKYRGQSRWTGYAAVSAGKSTVLELREFGGLKILSANKCHAELEIKSNDVITNKNIVLNREIYFPKVFEGLVIKAKKDNFWSEPVTIVAKQIQTIDLDKICPAPAESQPPIQPQIDIQKKN